MTPPNQTPFFPRVLQHAFNKSTLCRRRITFIFNLMVIANLGCDPKKTS
jgi:hypothetical protein